MPARPEIYYIPPAPLAGMEKGCPKLSISYPKVLQGFFSPLPVFELEKYLSVAILPIMPSQPDRYTNRPICTSWLNKPNEEKISNQSCDACSGSPTVTSGSIWALASDI